MTFAEYQNRTPATAIYPEKHKEIVKFSEVLPTTVEKLLDLHYVVNGLCGEVGEVANKVKKISRDKLGVISEEFKQDIRKEIGDILFYVSELANVLEFDLGQVAQDNLDKLASRKARGVIQGSGDNR